MTGTEQGTGWQEFKGDLKLALSTWGKAPALPLISLALAAVGYLPPPWIFLLLPISILGMGWVGTERVWYLRLFRGRGISPGELWKLTRAFILRYIFLGVIVGLVMLPVLFIVGMVAAEGFGRGTEGFPLSFFIPFLIITVIIDVALTFVTPALAFTTGQIGAAFRIGFRTLREEWPRSAWYALIPPFALVIISRWTSSTGLETTQQTAFGIGAAMLNLWFKGATAAFYLRRHEVGVWGAAFEDSPEIAADSALVEPLDTHEGPDEDQPDPMQSFYRRRR